MRSWAGPRGSPRAAAPPLRAGGCGLRIGIVCHGVHPDMSKTQVASQNRSLPKAATGIAGLDEITGGGLPRGRPTLVSGRAGCGKTLFAMEFLVRGATAIRRARRVHGLRGDRRGTDPERPLPRLRSRRARRTEEAADRLRPRRAQRDRGDRRVRSRKACSSAWVTPSTSIGAKRVVLDTIEALFAGLSNSGASCAPSCAGCSAGSRTRASRRSSPASAATARSPATVSRSTSPTASSCSTTGSPSSSRPAGCASSSTAARSTARTSTRS